jgi:hypothetical protein
MAYTINKTDGTILATVADGQVDQLSSDITLIGKNYSGFGEALNENFVKMLENFANSVRPEKPVRGQIWFDTTENKLKVYTGTAFVPVSSATISNTQPNTLGVGDLWFNNNDKQLYFYDGTDVILLGPSYSASQGLSGFKVQTILDKNNNSRVITLLYTNGTLLGIFSKDEFIPKIAINGFNNAGEDKIIFPGFNAGVLAGIKFNVTASNADRLDNTLASNFARKDQANILRFQTVIASDDGLSVGAGQQGLFDIDVGNVRLSNTASNRNLELRVRRGVDAETAINIVSSTQRVEIYNNQPNSLVTVGGSLIVDGNLTVSGTTTTINTEIITLEDKNLELAKISNPTDAFASGGGIIIKGTTDHRLVWIYDDAELGQANESWNTEESINIATGKAYKINGVDVLTADTCLVQNFPNLNQLGTLVDLTVDDIFLNDNRISTLQPSQDLELAPTGNITLINNKKITGLVTTNESLPSQINESSGVLSSDELSEATSKKYVTNLVRRRSIVLSLDITDSPSSAAIALLLTQVAPPNEYENGTIARLLCTAFSNSAVNVNLNPSLNKINNIEYNTSPSGTNFPLQDLTVNLVSIPGQTISVFRSVRVFELVAGAWSAVI